MVVPLADTEPYYDLGDYPPARRHALAAGAGLVRPGIGVGLRLRAYAFNHEEAIRCFERALALDADLALARWGIAYAIGLVMISPWTAPRWADDGLP